MRGILVLPLAFLLIFVCNLNAQVATALATESASSPTGSV